MADKVDVKDLLDGPDEFITFSDKVVKWSQDNLKIVIAGAVVFVLVICAIVGFSAYIDYRNQQAAEAISPAYRTYMEIVAGQGKEAELPKAQEEMQKAIQDYSATSAGIMGRLALGHLQLEKGEWKKAEALFNELSEESDLAPSLVPLAWHGLGKAREGLKKYSEAADAYVAAAGQGGTALKCLFTFDQARALALGGKKQQAADLYRQLIKDYPDDTYVARAKAALVNLDMDPES
jgi:predicted negative regulator of RcsB-dependent stress response